MTSYLPPPSFILSVTKLMQKLFWKRSSAHCVYKSNHRP